ncbi:hypothetical protein CEXT_52031 [Caerostris extrusa]|uniref:Uncharacterized protein n=1 Tax=Caerostris extrusa TaxID=172846 RepID=A0AAV4PPI2_CAEEX|nr:hypothetical protein CEXT_52031 [Caerostris extrusa]
MHSLKRERQSQFSCHAKGCTGCAVLGYSTTRRSQWGQQMCCIKNPNIPVMCVTSSLAPAKAQKGAELTAFSISKPTTSDASSIMSGLAGHGSHSLLGTAICRYILLQVAEKVAVRVVPSTTIESYFRHGKRGWARKSVHLTKPRQDQRASDSASKLQPGDRSPKCQSWVQPSRPARKLFTMALVSVPPSGICARGGAACQECTSSGLGAEWQCLRSASAYSDSIYFPV